jgi:hypothetical protein
MFSFGRNTLKTGWATTKPFSGHTVAEKTSALERTAMRLTHIISLEAVVKKLGVEPERGM